MWISWRLDIAVAVFLLLILWGTLKWSETSSARLQ